MKGRPLPPKSVMKNNRFVIRFHSFMTNIVKKKTSSPRSKNPSSAKDVLIKLKSYHPLPGVILDWRRLNTAVTKVVFPLQRSKSAHPFLGTERVYTRCVTHTATGRISLHEPNIQNIPRQVNKVMIL